MASSEYTVGFSLRRFSAAMAFFAGAILVGISTVSAWWSMSGSGSSLGGGDIGFIPGGDFSVTSGTTSGSISYASQGLGPVGALYEAILGLTIVLTILLVVVGIIGLFAGLGKLRSTRHQKNVKWITILVLVLSLITIVVVPTTQPTLFHRSAPSTCSSFGGVSSPCSSFWGSLRSGSSSLTWGADVGWYLAIASLVVLIAGMVLWLSAAKEPWGAGLTASARGPMVGDLNRLVELKSLLDSGHITPSEFQQVKSRLLGTDSPAASPTEAVQPASATDELAKLKSLHDTGVLTDSEYDELRKRAIARL
jgi:uncharacterized membrane protein